MSSQSILVAPWMMDLGKLAKKAVILHHRLLAQKSA